MPTLASRTNEPIKLLLLGDSGSGKTGALASLAKAGYRLRIADFDNGLDILADALKDDPDALARVDYETFTEKMKTIGGKATIDGLPRAWANCMNKLAKWGETDGVEKWGLDTVLCIDSLTFASKAAMNQVLALNNRLSAPKPYQSDWGQAQDMVENLLSLLYSSSVKCHVIVLSHVSYIPIEVDTGQKDSDGDPIMQIIDNKGLPMSVGKALAPKIPRYFNHSLIVHRVGTLRQISTRPVGIVEAKSGSLTVPAALPLATGLATYFTHFHKLK